MVQIFLWSGTTVHHHDVGDFVGAVTCGTHPGHAIVSGNEWDGPVTSDTLKIIDISAITSTSYIHRKFADHIASSFGYSGTPQTLLFYPNGITFDTDQFTSSVKSSLDSVGRAPMEFDDLWNTIGLTSYATSAEVESIATDHYTLDASDIPYF